MNGNNIDKTKKNFISYDTEKINMVLQILNKLEVKGLENVTALASVANILLNESKKAEEK